MSLVHPESEGAGCASTFRFRLLVSFKHEVGGWSFLPLVGFVGFVAPVFGATGVFDWFFSVLPFSLWTQKGW